AHARPPSSSTRPSGWPTSTRSAVPRKSPVSTTPGMARSADSSARAAAGSRSASRGAQSSRRFPLSVTSGPPRHASVRTIGRRPSARTRRITGPSANGITSTGIRPRSPSARTSLSGPTRITCRLDTAATIRSRTSAPPKPFTMSRFGATSSAPSTVRSSSTSSASPMIGMPRSRAWRSVTADVGTQVTRSPTRTRAPSCATNAAAAWPEPRPTRAPSVTSASARASTAVSAGSSAATVIAPTISARRAVPSPDVRRQRGGLGRPPAPGVVLVHRRPRSEDRIDDGPRRLDRVLAREERRIARHRVAEQPLVRVHLVRLGAMQDLELRRLGDHLLARPLGAGPDRDPHAGAQLEVDVVRLPRREPAERRPPERDLHLGRGGGETLPGADEERHAVPPPGVDVQTDRGEGLDLRIGRDALLLPVSAELPAHDVLGGERPHRPEDLHLLVADRLVIRRRRSLHREQPHHLQHVVLDHVADGARLLVEPAAPLDAEALGHRDLHALHVVPVPDRLEERVGEAEHEEVLHRLPPEIVVDAEDLRLVEDLVQRPVERLCRGEVAPEGLL